MAKQDEASAPVAVTPPVVRRGKKAVEIPEAVLEGFKSLIDNGEFAGDGKSYSNRAQANKAIVDYKKGLKAHWPECPELTSRTWGSDEDGWNIALKRKDS